LPEHGARASQNSAVTQPGDDPDEPLFSFGVIADVQYADSDSNLDMDRHFRLSIGKLNEAVTEFNQHPLEFIVHLGDLVDHDLENAPPVMDVLAHAQAPVRQVLGNHDFAAEQIPSGYSQVDDVLSALGLADRYYSFECPGWRMIVLDTNEVGIIENPPDSPEGRPGAELLDQIRADGRINAKPWNGTIGAEQRKWLSQTVRSATEQGLRSAVLAHHPVFPAHQDNLLDDEETATWLTGLDGLTLWLNGHQHAGGYGWYRGLHDLTFQGMVQAHTNAYALVTIYPGRMQVTGYGREPSRLLPLSD
jgi:3',5'-cyclic AMP phosphodiesterase CpdA